MVSNKNPDTKQSPAQQDTGLEGLRFSRTQLEPATLPHARRTCNIMSASPKSLVGYSDQTARETTFVFTQGAKKPGLRAGGLELGSDAEFDKILDREVSPLVAHASGSHSRGSVPTAVNKDDRDHAQRSVPTLISLN